MYLIKRLVNKKILCYSNRKMTYAEDKSEAIVLTLLF